MTYAQKCDRYQRYAYIQHQPMVYLSLIDNAWSLAQWGMDLFGLFLWHSNIIDS